LIAEDLLQTSGNTWSLHLRARGQGINAAQITARVSGTATMIFTPTTSMRLDENLPDLQARNHLYITAGATNFPLTFALNTSAFADGFHELTAVVYEGSSVHTQKRVPQNIRIQNSPLSAVFTVLFGGDVSAREATLLFSVVPNTNTISRIELYSTGGLLGSILNQPSASFSVPATNLDVGLHPFYALVTRNDGKQYRTETKWIRIIDAEPPFNIAISNPPPTLSWNATAGRSYDILSTTDLQLLFQPWATIIPSNSAARWVETNFNSPQRFYRVRVSP
jgi:hypothetical protein